MSHSQTVYPNELYTSQNDDYITFIGNEGESFFLRVNDITTQVFIENGSIVWQSSNMASESYIPSNYVVITGIGDNATLSVADKENNMEIIDINPFILYFTESYQKCGYTAMSEDLQNEVITLLNNNPGLKNWSQFNYDYHTWIELKKIADEGLICYTKVPDEPKIENYVL